MDELFQLIGEMKIPDDRKDEFNKYALTLLDRCGIRKLKEIKLAGKEIEVVERLKPDSHGIVKFDYSIYEKKKRKMCSYDTNTCELSAQDTEYTEFGMALILLMIMQESYSETPCYNTVRKSIIKVSRMSDIVTDILGIRLQFPHRRNPWETYMFWKRFEDMPEIDVLDVFEWEPTDSEEFDIGLLFDVLWSLKITKFAKSMRQVRISREQIPENSDFYIDRCLYTAFLKLIELKDDVESFVRDLVHTPFDERKELAKDDSLHGYIAEISLRATAVTLIRDLAVAQNTDFWELWDRVSVNGYYQDNSTGHNRKNIDSPPLAFFEGIDRESEDEFLGEWEHRQLELTDSMKQTIEKWKADYAAIELPDIFDMENEMGSILSDINTYWNVRRADRSFVREYLKNKDNPSYIKSLLLLRNVVDRYVDCFPELPRVFALTHVIRKTRSAFDSDELSALLGVLSSKKTREEIFAF